tara:strand:- start:3575 stop:4846 length:1272 start_codon:yes stop_codon:yes gene_type:complete
MIEELFLFKKKKKFYIRSPKRLDILFYSLLIIPLILVLISSLLIFSIQRNYLYSDAANHFITGILGGVIALIISYIPLDRLKVYVFPLYVLSISSLVMIYFFGISIYGAQRWLNLGLLSFQPSEIAKLATLLGLAIVLERRTIESIKDLFLPFLVVAIPWVLIFFQPDLGTSLVLIFLFFIMLYWKQMPIEWILLIIFSLPTAIFSFISNYLLIFWFPFLAYLAYRSFYKRRFFTFVAITFHSLVAKITPFLWNSGLKDYQKDRLILFLDPGRDPLGGGYHLLQSKIGIGSGGLLGTGLLNGKLTKLEFIPEQHTDFIFSAVGEEIGFVGTFLVVFLFFILIMQLVKISKQARTDFESLLVIGIASILFFQIIINIYMTIGLGPVTGIPLPFMSYGRTALLVNFIFIGFALSTTKRLRSLRKK